MKKLLLIILLSILTIYGWSQSSPGGMLSITSIVPSQITICGEAKLFTISITNPSPFSITNDTLVLSMPPGINYQASSMTGGATLITTIYNSNYTKYFFLLPPIPAYSPPPATLPSLNLTYTAKAQCNVLQFMSGGGIIKNDVRINYTANNVATYDFINTSTYFVKSPFLTITSISNQSYSAVIPATFTRCITVINGGSGELSSFSITDVHAAGIAISSISTGVLTNTGLTAKIVLNGTDFTSVGNGNNLFESGESITICETVNVSDCISGTSKIKAFWGCSINPCQSTPETPANVFFPNYVPNLIITPIPSQSSCLGSGSPSLQQLKIRNGGLGKATNVQLDIFQSTGGGYNTNVGSSIDPASFTIQVGIASTPVSITPTGSQNTNQLNCMPANPKGRVFINIPTINAGDTVYLKWNSYSCCWNSCAPSSGQSYINGWRYQGSYQSICQNNYVIYNNWGRVYSNIYGALTPDGSPATLSNGQTGTFNFLFSNYHNSYPVGPGANWKFEFTLPSFPCLSYSNIKILSYDGVTIWSPTSVTASGNTVTAIFNGSPPFTLSHAELMINLSLNCGLCNGTDSLTSISVKSYYIPDNTCGCEIGVSCQSIPFNINCPSPCPVGMLINNFDMSRTSLGLPDNEAGGGNGIPDGGGSLNPLKIKTNRAMFGDTITTAFTGILYKDISHPNLQFCYASSSISHGDLLSFLDAELFIYRAGALFATCTNFTPTITTSGSTSIFLYDLSVSSLISNGCALPGGGTYENTTFDSLIFKPRYKVATNIGNATPINCFSTNQFYLSDIANPTSEANKFHCGHYNGSCTVIGYFFLNHEAESYDTKSCDDIILKQNYYLSLGPGYNNNAGGNFFPYEYRNWAHISNLTAIIPAGYTFSSAQFNQIRTAGTLNTSTSPWIPITPSNLNSDTLSFPVDSNFPGTIPLGDDDFYGTLEVTVKPSCEVTPWTYKPVRNEITFTPVSLITGPGSDTTFLSEEDDQILYDPPVLFLQSPLPSILATSNTASWDVIISNTSNISNALNTWLSGPSISGVSIIQVVDLDLGTPISPINTGIYPVGTVNAMETRNFRITATYTSCFQDSLIIYSGWNCAVGYPSSVADYPCTPEKIVLTLTPLMPVFHLDITGPSSSIQLCDTASFTVDGVNAQLGTAYNVVLTATLPPGAILVSGSSQFSYPDTNQYINISDPTLISGNTYSWNISAIDSLIGIDGLKGLLDTTLNSFHLVFKTTTDCGFISGSTIISNITGNSSCGQVTEQEIFFSTPLDIIGAAGLYTTAIELSTTYVSPCAGNSTMLVVVHNLGPTAFGITDSVAITLPSGVPFINNSFSGIYNAPGSGTPLQYTLNGETYLSWQLPTGLAAGDSSVFTFQYKGNPHELGCGIIFFEAQTFSVSVITCLATQNDCITKIITGDSSLAVFTYKAYLSLSNGDATSIPNPPGGETVTVNYDITNTGQAILTDADSIVQFFYDSNGNGAYNPGDVFLAEDTLVIPKDSTVRYSSTFNVAAGQGCAIIAVIDPSVNSCVCDSSQLLILPSLKSLGKDTILCSGQTMVMNTDSVTGYTYVWTPVTDLSAGNIADPILTASNLTSAPIPTTYFLSTNRINCSSEDTILIIVNPLPTGTITGTTDVCVGATAPDIIFIGSTSTAPYTFTYTINGGANQTISTTNGDSVTLSAPTSVIGTYIYNLVSIQDASSTACFQTQNDSVIIKVNPLPTATVGGTTAVCKGATPPNIIFKGALGAAPYTFSYNINGGAIQTVSSINGDSAVVSVPIGIVGVYTYNLTGVQDSSSSFCFQAQNGSATITVNPLPTATIEGTAAVCLNDITFITFTGSEGTAPYTFTYTVNGGANQTVITTGGDTVVKILVPTVSNGSFKYVLWSVMDSSPTACSQSKEDSATVTIDPLPSASIDSSITVCQGASLPIITFVGYGGVSPYTFKYTINGDTQPTIVTIIGDSITLAAPTNTAGTFIYSLISVQDANIAACTHPQTGDATITVNPKPSANFTALKVCHGNATHFIDNSTTSFGIINTWSWNFGNGSPVNNTPSPFYIYPAAGIDTATLLVSNNFACSDTVTKAVTVNFNPTAYFTHHDVCFGDTVYFMDSSFVNSSFNLPDSVGTYLWDLGYPGSVNSYDTNTSHYYSLPDIYNVTLVVTTGNGCSDIVSIPVKVFDSPTSGFTFNDTCLFDSVLFTNTSLNPTLVTGTISSWSWNFGDGSTLVTNAWSPNHLYSAFGNYQVTLITHSSNLGCLDTLKDSITIFPMPIAAFSSADVCLNQAMFFYDSSTVAIGTVSGWLWNFGDSTLFGNTQNISHGFSFPTTHSVSLIATSIHGCKDTIAKNVVVHPLPEVDYSTTNVCDGSIVSYADLTTIPITDTLQSWTWDFDDNSTVDTNQNTSHLYTDPGSYSVQLVVVSSFGCIDSTAKTSIVNPNPVVDFGANDSTGCEPFCVSFQDSSSIITGNNVAWLWNFGDTSSTSNLQNSLFCYHNDSVYSPMYYTISLTVTSDSGCVATVSENNFITVYPKPNANFIVEPNTATIINPVISMTDLSIGANFWTWNFGDLDTASGLTPSPHTFADTGTYTITLITTTQYGCLDTAYQNIIIEPDFVFYIPNSFTPNDDGINDYFSGKGIFIIKYEMSIYDRWGNLIFFTDDLDKPWDGKANHGDEIAQMDVYIYSIKITDIKMTEHNYKGRVTLVK